jgi:hypothetical protein
MFKTKEEGEGSEKEKKEEEKKNEKCVIKGFIYPKHIYIVDHM